MDELQKLLAAANRAKADGVALQDINASLQSRVGMDYDALVKAVQQQTPPPRTPISTANLLLSGLQGATGDFGDELLGALASGKTGVRMLLAPLDPRYRKNRNLVRQMDERFRQEHKGADLAARLYGGLLPAIATGGIAGPAGGAGLLHNIGTGATVGAVFGGIQGAGAANELADVPAESAKGAAYGGVLGGGVGLLSGLVEPVAGVFNSARRVFFPRAAGVRDAVNEIRQVAQRTGLSAADLQRAIRVAQSRRPGIAVPADASLAFGRLIRANVNEASGNIERTIQQVTGRTAGSGERLAQDVRKLAGFGDRSASTAQAAVQAEQRATAQRLYRPLEERFATMPKNKALDELLQEPDVAPLWRKVRPRAGKTEHSGGFSHFQTLRQEMSDEIVSLQRNGRGFAARRMGELRDRLTQELEELVPGFRAANRAYYQTQRTIDAFDQGAEAVKKKFSGPTIAEDLSTITRQAGDEAPRAIEAYRHGMVDEQLTRLLNLSTNRDAGKTFIVMGPEQREALRAVFPSERSFAEFIERALLENRFSVLQNLTVGNSTTAQQVSDLLRSSRTAGFWGVKAAFLNWLARPNPAAASARADAISRLLLSSERHSVEELLQAIARHHLSSGSAVVAGASAGLAPEAGRWGSALTDEPNQEP